MEKIPSSTRIEGLDFARSLAILGMIIINFKIVMGASDNGTKTLITIVNALEGKAAATFVVLAGMGISLMTQDKNRVNINRKKLIKRAGFLLIVGLLYYPIWPADILHFYGLYLMIAALVFTLNSTILLIMAICATTIFVILVGVIDYTTGWNFATLNYTGFWTPTGFLRNSLYNGFHPVFPWIALLLFGMWVGRKDLLNTQTRNYLIKLGMILVTFSVATEIIGQSIAQTEDEVYIFSTSPMPPFPLFITMGFGVAQLIIICSINFVEKYHSNLVVKMIIATGQLALTNYVLHVVIGMLLLDIFGILIIPGGYPLWFAVAYAVVFYIILVVFSSWWLKKYSRGPLEYFMRKLTG